MMRPVTIIDRGRGPELAGTRITIYTLLDYFDDGWNDASIALWMGLSSMQVAAIRQYIAEHKDEVLAENAKILARIARGNPPEIEARRAGSKAKLQALREKLRRQREQGDNGEGHSQ